MMFVAAANVQVHCAEMLRGAPVIPDKMPWSQAFTPWSCIVGAAFSLFVIFASTTVLLAKLFGMLLVSVSQIFHTSFSTHYYVEICFLWGAKVLLQLAFNAMGVQR
uniref:Uncharacterized protein n=1 Tax=Rhipicephalus zambeziensis TaxID=60191 RepID=A0A224YGF4_9ACAR